MKPNIEVSMESEICGQIIFYQFYIYILLLFPARLSAKQDIFSFA